MQCSDCAEISLEVAKRLAVLTKLGHRAEALRDGASDKNSLETQIELAGILMQSHIITAEIDGLKIALQIHQRHHRPSVSLSDAGLAVIRR